MNHVLKVALISVLSVLGVSTALALSPSEQQIVERIKPIGEVCVQGDEDCGAVLVGGIDVTEPRSGQEIYDTKCAACHNIGVAGAPKLGDAVAWTARLDKGLDETVANAINGIGGMPPKGTCVDCSDEEIRVTVEYMVENSQ